MVLANPFVPALVFPKPFVPVFPNLLAPPLAFPNPFVPPLVFRNSPQIHYYECAFIVFILQCLHVQKQQANCLNIAEKSILLIVFNDVMSALTIIIALYNSDPRKALSWSVMVYNKNLSSQCNLTAQIETVQDKT